MNEVPTLTSLRSWTWVAAEGPTEITALSKLLVSTYRATTPARIVATLVAETLMSAWTPTAASEGVDAVTTRPGTVSLVAVRSAVFPVVSTEKSSVSPAPAHVPPTGSVFPVRAPAVWSNSSRAEKDVGDSTRTLADGSLYTTSVGNRTKQSASSSSPATVDFASSRNSQRV